VRLPDPFYSTGDHLAIDLPGARAVFTTRLGGVSSGPYATLNLGRLTADDPDAVRRNRDLVQERFGIGFAYARQVHGARVMRAPEPHDGRVEVEEADGLLTTTAGVAPMVLTADCMPIALAAGDAIAMLHAGWRGLLAGVIAEGVSAVQELAGTNGRVTAAIGPCARACCYEVGEEVHAAFRALPAATPDGGHLDMAAIASHQLGQAGVQIAHDCGLCTICSEDPPFFSHRRDRGLTGRQAGIAWRS
jgi:YfiH family protein